MPVLKKTLEGKQFTQVKQKGKYLILSLSGTKKKLVMHFGLTGSVDYKNTHDNPPNYAQVSFFFSDGSALYWINKRKFGKIWLVDSVDELDSLKKLGPNPLKISLQEFKQLVNERKRKNIKSFLMDQTILAGIGNEYSDEILYQAKINPHATMHDLSPATVKKFYTTMQDVLTYAIHIQTSESQEFKSSYLQAHRHGDKKCPRHPKHTLKKEAIAGRTSYYCPKDQS